EAAQRAGGDGRVVVEEEQVTAAGQLRGLVVGPREAAVRRVAVQDDVGELELDHVGGAVGRGVVDDDDLDGDSLVAERRQAGAQPAPVPRGIGWSSASRGGALFPPWRIVSNRPKTGKVLIWPLKSVQL